MKYVRYAAKALTAVLTIIVSGALAGELGIPAEWVLVIQAAIAGLSVFAIPNTELEG